MKATAGRRDMAAPAAVMGAVALTVSVYDLTVPVAVPALRYAVAVVGLLIGIATVRAGSRKGR